MDAHHIRLVLLRLDAKRARRQTCFPPHSTRHNLADASAGGGVHGYNVPVSVRTIRRRCRWRQLLLFLCHFVLVPVLSSARASQRTSTSPANGRWPKVPCFGKILPGSLVAIILGLATEAIIRGTSDYSTRTVAETAPIGGDLPQFYFPYPTGTEHWGTMIQYAISLALIGMIESVMTLQAVDGILQQVPSVFRCNQECFAQGVANFVCSLFGAMGGKSTAAAWGIASALQATFPFVWQEYKRSTPQNTCPGDAMIGQSTINVLNGARGRLSGTIPLSSKHFRAA